MTGIANENSAAAPGNEPPVPASKTESLPESEGLGLLLFEMTTQGVLCHDATGLIAANPAAQRMLGLSLDQLRGRSTFNSKWRYIQEDGADFPKNEQPGMLALRTGCEVWDAVIGVVNPETSSCQWYNANAKPQFRAGESTPYQSLTFLDEITERKRIQDALHANEEHWRTLFTNEQKRAAEAQLEGDETYRMLFQTINDALFVTELDDQGKLGKFIVVNDTACRRLGYSREELLSKTPTDITSENAKAHIGTRIRKILEQDHAIVATEHVAKDGRTIPIELSTKVAKLRNKTIFCSIARDITERKTLADAVQRERSFIASVLDTVPVGVVTVNAAGRVTSANQRAIAILGLRRDDPLQMTYDAPVWRISALDGSPFAEDKLPFSLVMATGKPVFGVKHAIHWPDAKRVILSINAAPAFDEQGRVAGMTASIEDITELERGEAERAKFENQLMQVQKMEAVGRLAGGVAHDFNNMLSAILGYVELAMESVDCTQSLHADLQEIQKAAGRSAELTRQLLAFARKQPVAPRVLNLNQTVEGMLNMLRRLIGENIELTFHPDADLWSVKLDSSQLDQILTNLCVNARDAITDVGKLTIETANRTFDEEYCAHNAGYDAGDYVQLTVNDSGSGMDQATLAVLFEPFFSTKQMGKGTGLGLATVYGIVKQNDGFIKVCSELGHGTTFNVYLPRHMGQTRLAVKSANIPAARGNETILLVEDEPSILNMTKRILERQGYNVITASSPGEAICLARECSRDIQLLVTDVVMPEMNGRALAKHLLSLFPGLKCLFMSGYTANVIAHHGVLDEGVNFIQKPFSKEDLSAKVRELLDSGNEATF